MLYKQENFFIVAQEFGNGGNVSTQRVSSYAEELANSYKLTVIYSQLSGMAPTSKRYKNIALTPMKLPRLLDRNGLSFYFALRKYFMSLVDIKPAGVLISGGPFYLFLVVLTLKKHYPSTKIFLDYRDCWTISNFGDRKRKMSFFGKIVMAFDSVIEKRILSYADLVSFATEGIKNKYCKKYPSLNHKSLTVYNGFSAHDIELSDKTFKKEKFSRNTILISGKFYYYAPELIRSFIKKITNQEKQLIEIAQLGMPEPELAIILKEAGIKYNNIGIVSHSQAIEYASSSMFGLVSNRSQDSVTVKVFDFLVNNKPVVLIGPRPLDFNNNYVSNFIITADKPLLDIIKEINSKNYKFDPKRTAKFNREQNAKKLSSEIQKIIQ